MQKEWFKEILMGQSRFPIHTNGVRVYVRILYCVQQTWTDWFQINMLTDLIKNNIETIEGAYQMCT